MPDTRRLLDLWIVETNTAYKAVPFETVANWLQQGRLLAEDRVRPTGTQDWFRIDGIRALGPYLPQPEPARIEDQAEALEPVETEFAWRQPGGQDDDDPDMIPLIDITLVLLIFFMMTAAVSTGMFAPIDTPAAEHQLLEIHPGSYWVAIDQDDKEQLRFALGKDDTELEKAGPTLTPVLGRLRKDLESANAGAYKVLLRVDQKLPIEVVKDATVALQQWETQVNADRAKANLGRIELKISGEVRAPK